MTASGSAEFTLNLISNASMETFPGNKLSSFTTLLPTPVTLSADWQVALQEISWPAMVRNVTEGQITFKNCAAPKVTAATSITEQKYSKQTTRGCVNESAATV